MQRSFSLVDQKVAETEFFLKRIREAGLDFLAARCYASAFTTAARSITYSLQAVMKPLSGFEWWYRRQQEELIACPTARFFQQLRIVNHHIGDNLVSGGECHARQVPRFWFIPTRDVPNVPGADVVTSCTAYFTLLLEIVYECYVEFGTEVDSHQHYTSEHFGKLGKTIEDAEEELFGVRGWTHVAGYSEEFRWQLMRDQMTGCEIDVIFREYLDKEVPRPPRLEPG
jgi:hypothetical protein